MCPFRIESPIKLVATHCPQPKEMIQSFLMKINLIINKQKYSDCQPSSDGFRIFVIQYHYGDTKVSYQVLNLTAHLPFCQLFFFHEETLLIKAIDVHIFNFPFCTTNFPCKTQSIQA